MRYTVTIIRPTTTYSTVEVEVDADDETKAYAAALVIDAKGELPWRSSSASDVGGDDVEVTSPNGPSISWKED